MCCCLLFSFAGFFTVPAQAIAVVDDVIIAAAVVMLTVAGVSFLADGVSSSGINDYIAGKISDYLDSINVSSISDWIGNGVHSFVNGTLRLGSSVAAPLRAFCDWFIAGNGITQGIETVVAPSLCSFTFADGSSYSILSGVIGSWAGSTFLPVSGCPYYLPNGNYITPVDSSNSYMGFYNSYGGLVSENRLSGSSSFAIYYSTSLKCLAFDRGGTSTGISNVTLDWFSAVSTPAISMTAADAITFPNLGTLTDDDELVYTPSIPWESPADVLDRAASGTLADSATSVSTATDTPAPDDPASDGFDWSPITSAFAGITQVFPFCIPWDMYNMVAQFDASAQAPSFDMELMGNDFTLDLSMFDAVAEVFRAFALLFWVVGLFALTKRFGGW